MAGPSIDAIAASITTVGQGRAALGEAARLLGQGYQRLAEVPGISGTRDAARTLLDQGNSYAQRVYNSLPSDSASQATPLDGTTRRMVQAALTQADSSLRLVEQVAGETYWDFAAALRIVAQSVGKTAGTVAGGVASAAGETGGSLLGGLLSGLGIGWGLVAVVALVVVLVGPARLFGLVRKVIP